MNQTAIGLADGNETKEVTPKKGAVIGFIVDVISEVIDFIGSIWGAIFSRKSGPRH